MADKIQSLEHLIMQISQDPPKEVHLFRDEKVCNAIDQNDFFKLSNLLIIDDDYLSLHSETVDMLINFIA